ncbi:unnamed protein product [Musa acuminata subsp. malaccensis]|uniref:(wild Malaysian banana) hypothetical protein n=1 Tax=Musa acuminata subsp. malaccensis TaxID=214687 RepID=A0A804KZK5_MUSAM|nr:PREDICTED: anthocyanidin 3-O-glucosyltransferase-like [Musa acuminata subsp. malaccensis]CAG1854418.1 unnamed protein product [Musa acuminata subsp. malaccensis]
MPQGTVASEWEIRMFLVAMPDGLVTGLDAAMRCVVSAAFLWMAEVVGVLRVPLCTDGAVLCAMFSVLEPSSAGSSSSTSFPASPPIESATSPRASSSAPSSPRSRASYAAWAKMSPKLPPASSTFARASTPPSTLAGSPRDGHRGLRKLRFGRDPAALRADQARGGVGGQRAAFLWSLKGQAEELLPPGFLDRTKGRGLVVSWAPQSDVLRHAAVGAFGTHCGWNSVLEAITAGAPMVRRPFFGDQSMTARSVSFVWKIGVEFEG